MKAIDVIAIVLLIVGGLNWGLVGLFQFDLVAALFGEGSLLARAVYSLVGFSALYQALAMRTQPRRWAASPVSHPDVRHRAAA